jgi:hypothetical protein
MTSASRPTGLSLAKDSNANICVSRMATQLKGSKMDSADRHVEGSEPKNQYTLSLYYSVRVTAQLELLSNIFFFFKFHNSTPYLYALGTHQDGKSPLTQ